MVLAWFIFVHGLYVFCDVDDSPYIFFDFQAPLQTQTQTQACGGGGGCGGARGSEGGGGGREGGERGRGREIYIPFKGYTNGPFTRYIRWTENHIYAPPTRTQHRSELIQILYVVDLTRGNFLVKYILVTS